MAGWAHPRIGDGSLEPHILMASEKEHVLVLAEEGSSAVGLVINAFLREALEAVVKHMPPPGYPSEDVAEAVGLGITLSLGS